MVESTPPQATVLRGGTDSPSATLFEGSFADACKMAWARPAVEREWIYIESGGVTYSPADLDEMQRQDQGEI